MSFPVSLIIPLYNESETIAALITTINEQSLLPAEIILVDGGSTDETVKLAKQLTANNSSFRIIEKGRAMPGKGRNFGAAEATHDWIAFTDAGIKLDKNWLQELVKVAAENNDAQIIYGNYFPQQNTFFDKCATIAYVAPIEENKIRSKFIASCLLKKEVWEKVGGFPDWRAAEDLAFMEKASALGYKEAFAPAAIVYWLLRPDITSTYKRFELYSIYNVWAKRQSSWHYGVAKQYLLLIAFVVAGILFSPYFFLFIPVWILARVVKRILSHRYEFGSATIFNPAILFMVALITLVIDAATFVGWIKALGRKNEIGKYPIAV